MATIYLSGRDEFFAINLNLVVYMQADDHYTHIYMLSGFHFLVPYGLSKIEQMIRHLDDVSNVIRLGRKYIVNVYYIYHVNFVRSSVHLVDNQGKSIVLHISKPVLRSLVEFMDKDSVKSSNETNL